MSGAGANGPAATATLTATATSQSAASGASTAAATGTAETASAGWVVPTNIGQCKPPAGNPAATFDNATAAGLRLVDDAGQPVNIALDANTLLIGAATWCGNTAKLKAQLATPEAQQALAGLRVVWAFGDEGGSGPHGVAKAEFLDGLPGERVFLAADSVRPWRFPSAFNGATGQFDLHPLDVIESYLATRRDEATGDPQFASRRDATTGLPETPTGLVLTNGAGAAFDVPLDGSTVVIAAATWCPHCAELKALLRQPAAQADLAGLRLVFAFGNEGGSGPGGVAQPEFLLDVPGEVAFLAPESVQPAAFPMAYNAASGQFDLQPLDAIGLAFASRRDATTGGRLSETATSMASGQGVCVLPGDFNGDSAVDAADYVVWRKQLGQMGAGLTADANGDQTVDQLDYDVWRAHLGDVCQLPGAFTITGPTGIQTQSSIFVTWAPSVGATNYRLTLSKQADLSLPFYETTLTGNSKNVFLHDGTNYVGVTAINASGETVATNYGFSFVVDLPPTDQLIFVTATNFSVVSTGAYPPAPTSFGSAAAADYQCTNIANVNGFLPEPWDGVTIYFRALVTQSTTSILIRAGLGNDTYYNTAGTVVAADRATLLSGDWAAPVLTQAGTQLTGTQTVWTGANPDGSASTNNCVNWTTTAGTVHYGNANGTGTDWLFHGVGACNSIARLYCVGNRP